MQASSGVTTLLFTDIEGSTRLWEQEGARMARALAEHDALSRKAVEANRGVIVKMTGDGMYAAFGDATPHVVLSERQTRRPTTPGAHGCEPLLKKMADI